MRNIIIIIIIFLSIILYINYGSIFSNKKIKEIITIGNFVNANEKDISSKLNQLIGENIYKVNLRSLKITIEDDPWIQSAQVSIQKPDTLIIKLTEFQALYIWNNNFYIDKNGNQIKIKKKLNTNLLKLNSNISSSRDMYILFTESQDILSNINLNILRIDRDLDTLEIYTNKYKFLVSFVIFKRKLREFTSIYDQFSSKSKVLKNIKNIDLRYPTGFAVQ